MAFILSHVIRFIQNVRHLITFAQCLIERVFVIGFVVTTLAVSAHAHTPDKVTSPTLVVTDKQSGTVGARPKIALVLSGGGARGAAHVGVLKVLEEMRVPIDMIVGTSMGALVGAAYASGTSAVELEDRLVKADWSDLLSDSSPREDRSFLRKEEDQARLLGFEFGVDKKGIKLPAGVISGQKLAGLFSRITRYAPGIVDFDRLPIQFRAVSTDAESGKMVVFSHGRLPDVMRASMSVPGAVAPYLIDDRIYLDGGLTRNLPIDVARELGADIVIAVNIGSGLLKRDELNSILGVSLQMINILTEQNVRASLESLTTKDVLITPQLDQISSTDFERAADAIKIGTEAARALAPRLADLSVSAILYAKHQDQQHQRLGRPVTEEDRIAEIRVSGLTRANEEELKRTLNIKPGEQVNFKKIDRGISRAFGTGYFERVNYSMLNEGERQILAVHAIEKNWGPHYLRLGLSMAADTVGEGRFNVLIRSQQTQINKAGAEWRNDLQLGRDNRFTTRFFQPFNFAPLGVGSFVNIAPGAEIGRRPIDLFVERKRVAQYDVTSSTQGLDFGLDVSRNQIARLGYVRGSDRARLSIGEPTLPEFNVKRAGIRFRLINDSLDDPSFPRTGRVVDIDYYASLSAIGASDNYRKSEISFANHYSKGAHTLTLAARYGDKSGDDLRLLDQFSLGGFQQLSGYRPGELLGQRVAFGRVTYTHKLSPALTIGRRAFAGISTEIGRIGGSTTATTGRDNKTSIGLFVGAESPLGPLYLGYGLTGERGSIFYFFLGQP